MLDSVQLRMPVSGFDETIREGLVNYLAHADYVQGFPSLKIDVFDGWFCFINPGKCLYHHSNFFWGGGVGGGPLIYKASVQNEFRGPEIITDINHTELKVWNIDLADSYPDLSMDEKAYWDI